MLSWRRLRRARPEEARAMALEREGRLREAIEVWSGLNLREPSIAIEKHLVALRHEAAKRLAIDDSPAAWPPLLRDPYPGVSGQPPECAADELTPALIGGAILHHGCLLVRSLLSTEGAAELVTTIDAAFDARDFVASRKRRESRSPYYAPDPDYDAAGGHAVVERSLCEQLGGLLVADSPRGLFKLTAALNAVGLPRLIGSCFGEPPVLAVEKCVFRKVHAPTPISAAWHQDGSFLGDGVRALDVWIALSRCGEQTDSPGLEIVPRRVDHLVAFGGDGARVEIEVPPEYVSDAASGARPVAPRFEAGDALIFDELFLHRTMPGGHRTRYAAEVWMFAPSHRTQRYMMLVP